MKPKDIIETVTSITGIHADEIKGKRRLNEICQARFMAAWGIKHIRPDYSFRQIARALDKENPTFAMHAVNRANELYDGCSVFRAMRNELTRRIGMEVAA